MADRRQQRFELSTHWCFEEAPFDYFVMNGNIFACCANGVYELSTQMRSFGQDNRPNFGEDDDEMLFVAGSPTAKKLKPDIVEKRTLLRSELKIKFKKPAKSCSISGSILVSLHKKSEGRFYLEANDLSTFSCLNPNIVIIDANPQLDGISSEPSIFCINTDRLIYKTLRSDEMGVVIAGLSEKCWLITMNAKTFTKEEMLTIPCRGRRVDLIIENELILRPIVSDPNGSYTRMESARNVLHSLFQCHLQIYYLKGGFLFVANWLLIS